MNAVSTAGWPSGFLSVLPAVQKHANIHFRRLHVGHRQDSVQEAIAAACVAYRVLATKGRRQVARASTVADFAVKHVRNGRHVGGRQDAARDALSPVAQARHHFTTGSIDLYDTESGEWRQLAIADHRNDPIADTACFRIDFTQWLRTLTRRDRRIIAAFTSGETTKTIAGRFGISPGRVSQLRRKYERLWLTFQGEPAAQAA